MAEQPLTAAEQVVRDALGATDAGTYHGQVQDLDARARETVAKLRPLLDTTPPQESEDADRRASGSLADAYRRGYRESARVDADPDDVIVVPDDLAAPQAEGEAASEKPGAWITEAVARAKERTAKLPPGARPVVTRPVEAQRAEDALRAATPTREATPGDLGAVDLIHASGALQAIAKNTVAVNRGTADRLQRIADDVLAHRCQVEPEIIEPDAGPFLNTTVGALACWYVGGEDRVWRLQDGRVRVMILDHAGHPRDPETLGRALLSAARYRAPAESTPLAVGDTVETAEQLDRLPDCTIGSGRDAAVKRDGRWTVTGMMLVAESARGQALGFLPARVLDLGAPS